MYCPQFWVPLWTGEKSSGKYRLTIPTKTTAGSGVKGFGDFYDYANAIALWAMPAAEDCANYCITLFSDLTRWLPCKIFS